MYHLLPLYYSRERLDLRVVLLNVLVPNCPCWCQQKARPRQSHQLRSVVGFSTSGSQGLCELRLCSASCAGLAALTRVQICCHLVVGVAYTRIRTLQASSGASEWKDRPYLLRTSALKDHIDFLEGPFKLFLLTHTGKKNVNMHCPEPRTQRSTPSKVTSKRAISDGIVKHEFSNEGTTQTCLRLCSFFKSQRNVCVGEVRHWSLAVLVCSDLGYIIYKHHARERNRTNFLSAKYCIPTIACTKICLDLMTCQDSS